MLVQVLSDFSLESYALKGLLRSPVPGPKGNIEFLAWLGGSGEGQPGQALEDLVAQVLAEVVRITYDSSFQSTTFRSYKGLGL